MPTHTSRQEIPVLADDDVLNIAVSAIVIQLDAALASRAITGLSAAFLPSAEHWQLVDLAVRQWATLRRGSLREWKQETCQGYEVSVGGKKVIDIHRPEECWLVEHEPEPRVLIDADKLWSPAQNGGAP